MAEFFDMGGYAAFVWPAFGLTFLVMAIMVVATLRRLRANQRELARLEAAGARRVRGEARKPKSEGEDAETQGEANRPAAEQRGVEA
ncbi:MAG: heme exporter protein CcmD [Kiloniellales bacterium]|nr:heme exporter protein CcmD [Kiloniellales bacterium]